MPLATQSLQESVYHNYLTAYDKVPTSIQYQTPPPRKIQLLARFNFLCVVYTCIMHIYSCVYICTYVHVCAHSCGGQAGITVSCLPVSLSIVFVEKGSVIEHAAHCFG